MKTIAILFYRNRISQLQLPTKVKMYGYQQSRNCSANQITCFGQRFDTLLAYGSVRFQFLTLGLSSAFLLIIRCQILILKTDQSSMIIL